MGKINKQTTQKNIENANKNANPIPNSVPFTPDRQPTSEQKKAGWERRKQAQEMMDKVKEYMSMSQKDFAELLQDIKEHPDKYTVQDVMLYKYATKAFNGEKFMIDWMDRNIGKAPVEVVGKDGENLTLRIVPILGGATSQIDTNVDNLSINDTIIDGDEVKG